VTASVTFCVRAALARRPTGLRVSSAPNAQTCREPRNRGGGTFFAYAAAQSIVELSFHARSPQAECERLTNCHQQQLAKKRAVDRSGLEALSLDLKESLQ
jgi:hypothetical protein